MLRAMRDNLKSLSITLWLVIAAFIVSIFVVYGMQSAGPGAGSATGAAATVNGERISWQEFQQAYRQQVNTLRRIYGDPPRHQKRQLDGHAARPSQDHGLRPGAVG